MDLWIYLIWFPMAFDLSLGYSVCHIGNDEIFLTAQTPARASFSITTYPL